MAIPQKLKGRYEIKEVLGQGGMGVVFRAYDGIVKRDVALKTLRDAPTRAALQMFYKECEVLAAMSHPNIIEIFDIGEYEEEGKTKPYFVMPLLPGATLDRLIRSSSHRLTVQRVVEIICQTCRGLHAAHERGLIHRDMKPSNLFVMDDDSVKIIDFGVAHMVEQGMTVGAKGTLLYMAPEQLQMKQPTPASDIYSLGVVCYETLTRRRPFEAATEKDIVDAVINLVPPPACDLNPAVSQLLSRVIHKSMAKQPWNRYSSAKEFAETLQKGLRNEPIDYFSPARIQPRIERASKAFEQGDHQFASEILAELEAEGHIDPTIAPLRRQIEHARRQKTIGQLIESAKTRFEHEEYPLALQKIEEILQIEPGNGQALGLRTSIENKLTSQKIEDWFRLARQHIDNQAFSHARDAIENVRQLRPNEPRAAQLLAEVDRLEQEYLRARREKEELYQSALDAWNCGEVSSALTKLERVLDLDRRSPDSSSTGRAATYQTFYNQVRSEHETLKNSYSEARKMLADHNFAQALAIVNEFLAKYPGHALFQALKFDIEEQQRQELSAKIVEIDREVEAEPDLDRKVSIIEQAVSAFPDEPHFQRQLRPMREKRDLVNSIVAKARYHEERGQFNDALAQWEILGTIYSQYPGLNFEIERVIKRREQQARAEAKSRWVEQIESAIQAGDYPRAHGLIEGAVAEFPGDSELAQLSDLARQSSERAGEAEKLFAEGQELCQQERFEDGVAAIRKALDLNPRNPVVRSALLDVLIARARALLDQDWRAAEPVIQQALEIDPNNLLAKSVRTAVGDHRRDDEVVRCFSQARQYRAAGDLTAALAEAEQCLARYPLDPRLAQLRDILHKELDDAQRTSARPADLAALRQLEQDAIAAGQWTDAATVMERARAIAARYPEDPEFHAAVGALEQRLASAASSRRFEVDTMGGATGAVPPPVAAAPPPAKPDKVPTPPAMPAAAPPAEPPKAVAKPAPPPKAAKPPKAPKPPKPPKPDKPAAKPAAAGAGMSPAVKWGIIGGAGLAALLLLVAVVINVRRSGSSGATLAVEVRTNPPGATIRVDGEIRGKSNSTLQVPEGTHQIDASLEGYQSASTPLKVTVGAAIPPVELTLQPLPQAVRVFSDLADGKVALDQDAARELVEGQLIQDSMSAGRHTLKITGRAAEGTVEFELAPGQIPRIAGAPQVKNLLALVVANYGSHGRVYSNLAQAQVQLNGQPVGEIGPEGLDLPTLSPGAHELALADGKGQPLKRMVEVGAAPSLTAFFQSDQNVGTIVVLTGEDGVDVFVDGKKFRRQTARGSVRIPREPREYRIRIAKEGFEAVPPEQSVTIAKGEEKKLEFKLVPLPTSAQLAFQGAPSGAQVLLDGSEIGTVGADGGFHAGSVSPGEHTIELRRDRATSRPVRKTFVAGETVQLAPAEVALRATTGTLRVTGTPQGAQVTVARAGAAPQPVTGGGITLEEGSYTVTARAPGYVERSETVKITAGQPATVNLPLSREQQAAPKIVIVGMEGWEQPGGWKLDSGWYVRRGGNFVLYRPMEKPGSYAFNAMVVSGGLLGGKSLQWVISYTDARNYILCHVDPTEFRRIQSVNGKRSELVKKPHGLNLREQFLLTVQVEVAPGALVQRIQKDKQWIVLDEWRVVGRDFTQGRFGFDLGGRDEIRLSGFAFHAKEGGL